MNEVSPGGMPTHQPLADTAQGPSSHPPKAEDEFNIDEEHARAIQPSRHVFNEPEIVAKAGDNVIP